MTEDCTNALTQMEIIIRDEPELRFKTPHKGIIKNQKKSMPRETEKHSLIHMRIDGKQTSGPSLGERDQKNLKSLKGGNGVMICFFSKNFLVGIVHRGSHPRSSNYTVFATGVCTDTRL